MSTILSHKAPLNRYFVMYFIYYNKDGLKPLQIDVDSSDTVILPSVLESEWMDLLYKCPYPCLFQGIGGLNSLRFLDWD